MSYYPSTYNRLTDGTQIERGMSVEVVETDHWYDEPGDVRVIHEGVVTGLDNRKSSEGYTVLIQTPAGVLSARPDELRLAGAEENR